MIISGVDISQEFRAFKPGFIEAGSRRSMFGERTVIYGRNGSGKTSLSELLRSANSADVEDVVPLSLLISDSEVNAPQNLKVKEVLSRLDLFVYNRYYVQRNLHAFLSGESAAEKIVRVVLGAENAEKLGAAERIEERGAANSARLEGLKPEMRAAKLEQSTIEEEVKSETIAALAAVNPARYNTSRFTLRSVKNLLAVTEPSEPSADDLENLLAIASEGMSERGRVPLPQLPRSPAKHLAELNDSILWETVAYRPDERLDGDHILKAWVEGGIEIHAPGQKCEFCREGIYDKDLDQHYQEVFSDSLRAFRASLEHARTCIESMIAETALFSDGLPEVSTFSSELQPEWSDELHKLRAIIEKREAAFRRALELIEERRQNELASLSSDTPRLQEVPEIVLSVTERIIARQFELDEAASERANDAQSAIERHIAASKVEEHRHAVKRCERLAVYRDHLRGTVSRATQEAARLRSELADSSGVAKGIEFDLRYNFGHISLSVVPHKDGGYAVMRSGKPAKHLSEGERNSLALTYFIRSLEADGVDPRRTVVVIDDPVTSMDKDSIYAGHALMVERLTDFAQVIHLTHDFDYLRLLHRAYSGRRSADVKYMKENSGAQSAHPKHAILELSRRSESRPTLLREMPLRMSGSMSEYQYLFAFTARALVSEDADLLPVVGNAARRLLEGFIAFRSPHRDDFQSRVDATSKEAGRVISKPLKERVVRFLHSQSHRENPDPESGFQFGGVRPGIADALEFMFIADPRHFDHMCSVVEIDAEDLLEQITDIR